MANQLHLDFVGNQARIFNGNLLGLPVISLPYRSASMKNLKVTIEMTPKNNQLHFGTQVTPGIESPKSIHTEKFDTLYSFNNDQVDLKNRFSIYNEGNSKFDCNHKIESPHFVSAQQLRKIQNSNLSNHSKETKVNKIKLGKNTPPFVERISVFGRLAQKQIDQQDSKIQRIKMPNSAIRRSLLQQTEVKIRQFSYDALPQIQQMKQEFDNQEVKSKLNTFKKPPRHTKTGNAVLQINEKINLKKYHSQNNLSNTQPLRLKTAKENLAELVQPCEFYTVKVQSSFQELFFEVKTRDQYVKKYLEQGKFEKIKNKDPQIQGILGILNGQFSKAEKLLKEKNLCICLMEQGKINDAIILAQQLNLQDILTSIDIYKSNYQEQSENKHEASKSTNQLDNSSQMNLQNNFQEQSTEQTRLKQQNDTEDSKRHDLKFDDVLPQSRDQKLSDKTGSSSSPQSQQSQVYDLPVEVHSKSRVLQMSRSAKNFRSVQYFKSSDRPLSSQKPFSGQLSDNNIINNNLHDEDLSNQGEKPINKITYEKQISQILKQQIAFSEIKDESISDNNQTKLKQQTVSRNIGIYQDSQKISIGPESELTSKNKLYSTLSQQVKQVGDIKTEDLLSTLVQQRLAGIERFKLYIGGQERMEKYIEQYAEEWRSGKIRYQNTFKVPDRPWSTKKQESAYELSKTKYKEFKGTINLLVEDYLNRDDSKQNEEVSLSKFNTKLLKDSEFAEATSLTGKQLETPMSDFKIKVNLNQTLNNFDQLTSQIRQPQNAETYKQEPDRNFNQVANEKFDIDIPESLKDRFESAMKTIKQGITDPLVSELMSTQLTRQEIYDRSKAVRHMEKLLADDSLLSANSEHLEQDFWSKVQILHRNEQKQDLFYIDEQLTSNIIGRLTEIANRDLNNDESASKENQTPADLPISNLLNLLKKEETQKTNSGQFELARWFNQLYQEISVSNSLHILLEQRYQFFQQAVHSDEQLNNGQQQQNIAYSILLTIREQFAKKQLDLDVDYEMLAIMLSANNYFSHFNSITRKKLLLISKHRLVKQGEVLLHSDQLNDTIVVVISGAVSVHMCNKAKRNLRSFRNTLYPGESIGDAPLRLIIPADKVQELYFELKAAVDSDVLLIKKDDVPSILENEIRALISAKIIPLQRCSLFSGPDLQSPYSIFVLANLVQTKTFKIGDIIQQQGKQAQDSMYLVVRGFCKAVFQTTLVQLHRRKNERISKLNHSKETYGELGVIQQHLNCINPSFVVKNIRQSLLNKVEKIQPGYLPKIKRNLKKRKVGEESEVQNLTNQILEQSDQQEKFISARNHQAQDENYKTQLNTAEDSDSDVTNRTQKLRDQEALVGHQRPKIIESTFEFKDKMPRLIQNTDIPLDQISIHDKVHVLKSKLASKNLKTAKVDLITHTNRIGEGETFCMRALLDKQRCVKQLQNELTEFQTQLRLAEEKRQMEFMKKTGSPIVKRVQSSTRDGKKEQIESQMKINDDNLPEGIRQKVQEPETVETEHNINSDLFGSNAFQVMFKHLRALLGDDQVRNKTAQQLFDHLNQSQLTIVADSSDVLVLCIRYQDLFQLSEPVRRRVERDILSQYFVDLDRPFTDRKDLKNFISSHKQWQKQKLTLADSIIFNQ